MKCSAAWAVAALLVATGADAQAPTTLYREATTAPSIIIIPGTPAFTSALADDYIDYMAWYFDIRFSPSQRQRFTDFLKSDWIASAQYRTNIIETSKAYRAIRRTPFLQAESQRAQIKASGAQADAMRMMIDQNAPPQELHNLIKYNAARGNLESQWLADAIEAATRPLVSTRDFSAKPFTRREVDALADLLAFRANAVVGRRTIEPTESMRDALQAFLVDFWNRNSSRHGELYLWLFSSRASWAEIVHNGRSIPTRPTTPYQLRREIRDYAAQTALWFPKLRPYSDRRIAEYEAYVARMTPAEMQMELNLMQQQAAVAKQSAQALRNQLVKTHVVNMNGIEAIGGGREWEYRTVTSPTTP